MRTVMISNREFNVADTPADFWGWVGEGRYDNEWAMLLKYLRPEHTFVDLGAWVGSHSLFASTIAKRVISVEPDPVAFAILTENATLNGKLETVSIAISDQEKMITLGSGLLGASTTRANRHGGGGVGAWEPGQQFDVQGTTLRKFCEDHKIEDPMFLKIDIEGSEEMVIRDMEFFQEHKPTIYLETHPFWWRDERSAWTNMRRLAELYKNVYDPARRQVIDLSTARPRCVVFTSAVSS